jgi:hypothetical protein
LLSWHLNNPKHDVIFVTLDIKSTDGAIPPFPDEIDSYIREYFDSDLLFTPAMLMTTPRLSLCQNVIQNGWPDISSLGGKFIFCLSGNVDWKSFYAATKIRKRLCFSDYNVLDNHSNIVAPDDGNFVVFNMHIISDDHGTWKNTLPLFFAKNLLTRVYVADSSSLWNNALHASSSMIATDEISNRPWARVGNKPFVKRQVI